MKTLYLLITLSQNAAGDINAAFVNTETLEQCQQKAVLVENIFKNSSIPVLESRCTKTNLKFSEFGHAANSRDIRYFYLISFNDNSTNIITMADWKSCMLQKNNKKVYCSSSVQSVI